MTKRLFALVVALAVVSAPIALEVCQVRCESKGIDPSTSHAADGHAGHRHMPAGHASCHEHGGAVQQVSTGNVPCDHGTDATPSLVAAKNPDAAASLLSVVPVGHVTATVETRGTVSVRESTRSDRLVIPLAIPLRV
jgi:hypothetical protein